MDEAARAYRACPRHHLELAELRDGSLRCPRGHHCRTWVVMLKGEAVAAGRLDGRVKTWVPIPLRELRGFLEVDVERSAV